MIDNAQKQSRRDTGNNGAVRGAAVVLICNQDYILPTLSSAISARRNIRDVGVDVMIYVLGEQPVWGEAFKRHLEGIGISLTWQTIPMLDELARFHRDRYLPPITLARFWLDDMLPDRISRFLYIDGDVMVDGDLGSLVDTAPPAGKIRVVPDNMLLFIDEIGAAVKRDRAYLTSLGVDHTAYFNAGVIYTDRKTWVPIARDAMRFMKENPDLCRSSDQSALNHASRGKTDFMSQAFNFQSEHMMVIGNHRADPAPVIYHFTGGPKPWVDASWPWSEYFNRYFHEAEVICAEFDIVLGNPPETQTAAGIAHRKRFRFRQAWLYPWRQGARRAKLKRLL